MMNNKPLSTDVRVALIRALGRVIVDLTHGNPSYLALAADSVAYVLMDLVPYLDASREAELRRAINTANPDGCHNSGGAS
jgi:hypothetical protein